MLWWVFDIVIELFCESFSVFILGEHDCTSVEYEPSDYEYEISYNKYFFWIDLMVFIYILVIIINKLDALIFFKVWKLEEQFL